MSDYDATLVISKYCYKDAVRKQDNVLRTLPVT